FLLEPDAADHRAAFDIEHHRACQGAGNCATSDTENIRTGQQESLAVVTQPLLAAETAGSILGEGEPVRSHDVPPGDVPDGQNHLLVFRLAFRLLQART